MIKVGIFVSAGLGNALLQIPMLRYLRSKNYYIIGFFTSKYNCDALFEEGDLFDEKIILKSSAIEDTIAITKRYQSLDTVYLDYFSATKKNIVIAKTLSKKIVTNRPEHLIPKVLRSGLECHPLVENIHEGLQYLKLVGSTKSKLSEQDFSLLQKNDHTHEKSGQFSLPKTYIAVQISAGNSNTPYKVWPKDNWRSFFKKIAHQNYTFVLLGDNTELELGKYVAEGQEHIVNLIGQTSINDCIHLINNCSSYLGLDSGLMHLAVALHKPTFTLWGGSDYQMYGYQNVDPDRHFVIYEKMDCWPCNSYVRPNTTRIDDPLKCPDLKCLTTISIERVIDKFEVFIKSLGFDK